MIDTQIFLNYLMDNDIRSFYGVPDSLLKKLCKKFLDLPETKHQISTNEGTAIASAIGHHLATGETACVYFQNSGLGNTINPLVSLASRDVYSIPILLIIGWRGEIGANGEQLKDEPQHIQQGQITLKQLQIIDIPYEIISSKDQKWKEKVSKIINISREQNRPAAIICRKNTFIEKSKIKDYIKQKNLNLMTREDAIKQICKIVPNDIPIFSTTGMASRELYEFRKSNNNLPIDFYTVGGMGCAASIALGYIRASKRSKKALCIDGDGSLLMHMGSLFKIAKQRGLIHIVLNNDAHDSVGGQPTDAFQIDFQKLGSSLGFNICFSTYLKDEIDNILEKAINDYSKSYFIEIKVSKGNREDLGRPKERPLENKKLFMDKWSNL